MKFLRIAMSLFVSMGYCSASAQAFTATERSEIIDHVIEQLVNRYVDPNLGQKAAQALKRKKEKQAYDALETKASLIEALMADMHEATGDRQLQLKDQSEAGSDWIHPALTIEIPDGTEMDDRYKKAILQMINYGFPVQVQEGHIGHLAVLEFYSPEIVPEVYQVIDKTMRSLQECTAIILDLRQCSRGGDPEVMMYLASYFLGGEESQPLYVSFDRQNQKIAEFGTRTDVPGKRMPNVPLYALVSSETFSTGEMFAYGLQGIGRARLLGEPTVGAAHATDTVGIGNGVMMVVPVHRLVHVKTKANWEGTGVIPDVPTKAKEALDVAKAMIRKARGNGK